MFKKSVNFYIFTFSACFIFFMIPCVNAQNNLYNASEEHQILILVGPHYGLPMLEAIIPATVSTLIDNGISLDNIFVEFLDLHRQSSPQHRHNLLTLLEHKLVNSSVGLIIAVNQGAVDFISQDGSDLLPGVPMLIPILEEKPHWEGVPRRLITLTTSQDAEGTLSYALSLFPKTQQVLIIMGKDDLAAPFLNPLLKALEDRGSDLKIKSTADISYEMMLEKISSLPYNSIAFYGSYFHDITDRSFVPAEVAALVSEKANCPVFAFRDMHIAQGLTGGSVTITSDLGRKTAHISLDYLSGNLNLEQPVTYFEIPSFPLFDWAQLERWGADAHVLPSNTIFLNRTTTLWSQHREAVVVAFASFVLLLLLLFLLILKIRQLRIAIQQHKRTLTNLEASEARYRHLFEAANVGKSVTLPTGKISANNAYCEMLGYTSGELQNTTWQELTPAEDINAINNILAPLYEGLKDTARFEKRYIHKNGSLIWADVSTVIQRDENGKALYLITTIVDITEQKRTVELLRNSEHQYRSLFNNMNAGFVLFEVMLNEEDIPVDLFIIDANEGFSKTTELKLSEAIGRPLTEVLPGIELDSADWIGTYGKIAVSGGSQQFENESELLGFYYSISAFQAEQNICAVTFIDITDHKNAEIKLCETNSRLKAFLKISQIINSSFELSSLLQMIVDNATRVMHLGSGAIYILEENDKIRLAATTPELQIDLPDEILITSLDDHPHIKKAMATGRYVIMKDSETATLTPSEHQIVITLNLRSNLYLPIRLQEESIGILILSSIHDLYTFNEMDVILLQGFADQAAYAINNIRNYEKAIAHSSELEQHIFERNQLEGERTKLQAQLAHAQKMESIGRLAGGVAHDFNNMLGVILGHTEIAMEHLHKSNSLYSVMEEIHKAAQRSADITRQLLTFARKQNVTPKLINMNEIVAGMLKMIIRLIGEHISIEWKPCQKPCFIKMDPTQLDQVLANLCVNARDAIDGTGKIIIATDHISFDEDYCALHAGFTPGDYVLLAVSDDGCGIESESLNYLFDPFYTTKEQGKGTGLGLATVYGAVKQNQGYINVYSEPGQGTTFKIYFPRHIEDKKQHPEEDYSHTMLNGHETILLVEDEPQILKVTKMLLEKLGYTVIPAASPVEAIHLSDEYAGRFDLLLTDLIMPQMNGHELVNIVLTKYPGIVHLYMSGHTADFIGHQGVLDEDEHFIQKPFSMKNLAAKIREVLENR